MRNELPTSRSDRGWDLLNLPQASDLRPLEAPRLDAPALIPEEGALSPGVLMGGIALVVAWAILLFAPVGPGLAPPTPALSYARFSPVGPGDPVRWAAWQGGRLVVEVGDGWRDLSPEDRAARLELLSAALPEGAEVSVVGGASRSWGAGDGVQSQEAR